MKQKLGLLFLSYLRFWARLQLRKNHPRIVGITGSAGKTSALHAVEAVLVDFFPIKVSHKANSESGLPLNILGLEVKNFSLKEWLLLLVKVPWKFLFKWEKYYIYVAEMGIDGPFPPKNMSYLLTILQPEVGIFLNARAMHTHGFDALVKTSDPFIRKEKVLQLIATEKGKIITSLPAEGLAVLNHDDHRVAELQAQTRAYTHFFGQGEDNEIRIVSIETSLDGTSFTFQHHDTSSFVSFKNYLMPDNFGYSFAAAIITGMYFDIEFEKCCEALKKNFKLPPGRSTLIPGINHSLILDSSYNASAQAMKDSISLLRLSKGRKLALLGDMRELGKVAEQEHLLVGQYAAEICDAVYLIGPQMKEYVVPLFKKKAVEYKWFETAGEAGKYLSSILKKDDMLLVKGSQNTLFLEIAVEQLMNNPDQANDLLCRRGSFWDQQRQPYL